MNEQAGTRGLTRREVIKRGAVVGGVVWAAPTIESIWSSAAAASGPTPRHTFPTCNNTQCSGGLGCSAYFIVFTKASTPGVFYTIKIDTCGTTCSSSCGVPADVPHPFPSTTCGGHTFTDVSGVINVDGVATTCDFLNCSSDITISGNTITAGPGVTFIFEAVHDGSFATHWMTGCI
jgi:hypothetical protein